MSNVEKNNKDFGVGRSFRLIFCSIIIVVLLSYLFWGLHVELYPGDENYMALCCKNWKLSPLGLLTFYQGHLWASVFGEEVYFLRILAKLSQLVAIGIGCLFLYKKSSNLVLTLSVAFTTILVTYLANHQLYGWDNGAYPSEALFTVCLMMYISRPSVKKIIALGVACGLMMSYRLPLAIGSMISLGAIFICRKNTPNYAFQVVKDSAIGLVFMILVWTCIGLCVCGSINEYINCYSSDNFITGHGNIIRLLIPETSRIIGLLPGIMFSSMLGWIAFLISVVLSKYKRMPISIIIICNSLIGILSLCVLNYYLYTGWRLIAGIGIPIFICTIGLLLVKGYLNKSNGIVSAKHKKEFIQLIFLCFCFVLPTVGSDTWFERFTICFCFPIAIGVIWPILNEQGKRIFTIFFKIFIPSMCLITFVNISYYMQTGTAEDVEKWGVKVGTTQNSLIMNQIEPMTKILRSNGYSYTFFCSASRFAYIYAFEEIKNNTKLSYPLHDFYVRDQDTSKIEGLASKDVIIFPDGKISSYPTIVNHLKNEHGYSEWKYSEQVDILYKSKPKLIKCLDINQDKDHDGH